MSSWDIDLTFLSLFSLLDCARLNRWHSSSRTCLRDTLSLTCPKRSSWFPPPQKPSSPSHPRLVRSTPLLKPKTKTCSRFSYLTSASAFLTLPPQFIWRVSSLQACCLHPTSGWDHLLLGQQLRALFDLNVIYQLFLSFKDAERFIIKVLILAYWKAGAGKRFASITLFSWLAQLLYPPLRGSLPLAAAPRALERMTSCLGQGLQSFSWSDDLGTANDKFNCTQPWREVRKPN